MEERFDFCALERRIGGEDTYVAARLGIAVGTVARLRQEGLSEERADFYATRAGHHPGEVWPQWWSDDSYGPVLFANLRNSIRKAVRAIPGVYGELERLTWERCRSCSVEFDPAAHQWRCPWCEAPHERVSA